MGGCLSVRGVARPTHTTRMPDVSDLLVIVAVVGVILKDDGDMYDSIC